MNLRNPLAPIRNGIELLRRDEKGPGVKQLDMMERQIQRLVRLVDDLLEIARIESGHVELRKEPVDLVKVVNQAIEESRHLFDDRHHRLSLFLPSEPVRVMADPVRLEQIVANLLTNSAKIYRSRVARSRSSLSTRRMMQSLRCATMESGLRRNRCRSYSRCSSRPTLPSTGRPADWGSG